MKSFREYINKSNSIRIVLTLLIVLPTVCNGQNSIQASQNQMMIWNKPLWVSFLKMAPSLPALPFFLTGDPNSLSPPSKTFLEDDTYTFAKKILEDRKKAEQDHERQETENQKWQQIVKRYVHSEHIPNSVKIIDSINSELGNPTSILTSDETPIDLPPPIEKGGASDEAWRYFIALEESEKDLVSKFITEEDWDNLDAVQLESITESIVMAISRKEIVRKRDNHSDGIVPSTSLIRLVKWSGSKGHSRSMYYEGGSDLPEGWLSVIALDERSDKYLIISMSNSKSTGEASSEAPPSVLHLELVRRVLVKKGERKDDNLYSFEESSEQISDECTSNLYSTLSSMPFYIMEIINNQIARVQVSEFSNSGLLTLEYSDTNDANHVELRNPPSPDNNLDTKIENFLDNLDEIESNLILRMLIISTPLLQRSLGDCFTVFNYKETIKKTIDKGKEISKPVRLILGDFSAGQQGYRVRLGIAVINTNTYLTFEIIKGGYDDTLCWPASLSLNFYIWGDREVVMDELHSFNNLNRPVKSSDMTSNTIKAINFKINDQYLVANRHLQIAFTVTPVTKEIEIEVKKYIKSSAFPDDQIPE